MSQRTDWLVVGPPLGESGGVATSVQASVGHLERLGGRVHRGAIRPISSLASLFSSRLSANAGSLYHCSSMRSIRICALHARIVRSPVRVLFIHGGRAGLALSRTHRRQATLLCGPFSHLWTTNQAMAGELRRVLPAGFGERISVVAPVDLADPRVVSTDLPRSGENYAAVIAVGGPVDLYGLSIGLATRSRLEAAGAAATLQVLAYGDARLDVITELCEAHGPAVAILEGLGPDAVEQILGRADVLLRPTTTDGDAVIVRQALAAGTRVVASDVVPRPLGCEVASLGTFPEAVLSGGSAVEADELGISIGVAIRGLTGGETTSS